MLVSHQAFHSDQKLCKNNIVSRIYSQIHKQCTMHSITDSNSDYLMGSFSLMKLKSSVRCTSRDLGGEALSELD